MCRVLRKLLLLALMLVLGACNIRTNGATNTPYPTPDIPTASFIFPANLATIVEGTDVNVQVLAQDAGAGVADIQLQVDDLAAGDAKPQVSAAVPVFNAIIHWLAQGVGNHSMTLTAYRTDGTASAPVTIIVKVLPRS